MRYSALPLSIRLAVPGVFLILLIVATVLPVPLFIPSAFCLALLLGGSVKARASRLPIVLAILIPFAIGLSLVHFDLGHPFARTYVFACFSAVGILAIMDALTLEETVQLVRALPAPLAESVLSALIGVALGRVGLPDAVRIELASRRDSGAGRWGESSRLGRTLDSAGHAVRIVADGYFEVERSLELWEAWSRSADEMDAARRFPSKLIDHLQSPQVLRDACRSPGRCSLDDVYSLPYFREMIKAASNRMPLGGAWIRFTETVPADSRILEIGPGEGHFTRELLRRFDAITVIERDLLWAEAMAHCGGSDPRRVRVITDSFPCALAEQYDVVVLHQNVFLEILNQIGMEPTVRALVGSVRPGGVIAFDLTTGPYPSSAELYRGDPLPGVSVNYYFTDHSAAQDRHSATLHYSVIGPGDEDWALQLRLEFDAPGLDDVLEAFRMAGASVQTTPVPDLMTFFRSPMYLLEVRRTA